MSGGRTEDCRGTAGKPCFPSSALDWILGKVSSRFQDPARLQRVIVHLIGAKNQSARALWLAVVMALFYDRRADLQIRLE